MYVCMYVCMNVFEKLFSQPTEGMLAEHLEQPPPGLSTAERFKPLLRNINSNLDLSFQSLQLSIPTAHTFHHSADKVAVMTKTRRSVGSLMQSFLINLSLVPSLESNGNKTTSKTMALLTLKLYMVLISL